MQSDVSIPMRVLKTNIKADSVILKKKSENVVVNPDDEVLQTFVKRLHTTVKDSASLGVGIAAPQVGILKNIIWVQRFDKENSNRKYNCWNNFSGENVDFNKNNF
jgi:peptide deformylase